MHEKFYLHSTILFLIAQKLIQILILTIFIPFVKLTYKEHLCNFHM